MAGMTGSMSTRSCHPEFLRRMSRLVSLVTGREIIFRLPFYQWTKGEMVRAMNEAGLADLAPSDSLLCTLSVEPPVLQTMRDLFGLHFPSAGDDRRRNRRTGRHLFLRPI